MHITTASMLAINRYQLPWFNLTANKPQIRLKNQHMLQNDTVVIEQWWEIEVKIPKLSQSTYFGSFFMQSSKSNKSMLPKNINKLNSSRITLWIPKQNDQHHFTTNSNTDLFRQELMALYNTITSQYTK
jgi:hypothetical protein